MRNVDPTPKTAGMASRPSLSFAASIAVHTAALGGALLWSARSADPSLEAAGSRVGVATMRFELPAYAQRLPEPPEFPEPAESARPNEPYEPSEPDQPDEPSESGEWPQQALAEFEPVLLPVFFEPAPVADPSFEALPDWIVAAATVQRFMRRPIEASSDETDVGELELPLLAELAQPADSASEQPTSSNPVPVDPVPVDPVSVDPVGGPVAADATGEVAAQPNHCPRPDYPVRSQRRGEEGTVRCALHIDAKGRVTRVELLRSSGFDRLDERALDVLATWTFKPQRSGGLALACVFEHDVEFRLRTN